MSNKLANLESIQFIQTWVSSTAHHILSGVLRIWLIIELQDKKYGKWLTNSDYALQHLGHIGLAPSEGKERVIERWDSKHKEQTDNERNDRWRIDLREASRVHKAEKSLRFSFHTLHYGRQYTFLWGPIYHGCTHLSILYIYYQQPLTYSYVHNITYLSSCSQLISLLTLYTLDSHYIYSSTFIWVQHGHKRIMSHLSV